ncbi:MAG: GTPase ObgE [Gemmatimonadota bacterium]
MTFVDRVEIRVEGGVGGSGAEAFRRESGVPRGGPAGGDGGKGGSVYLVVNPQVTTLLDLRYHPEYRAERGQHGEGSNRTGRSGEDTHVQVPPGTVVRDVGTGETLGELLAEGDRLLVAKGGRGGRGNAQFATATNQAPTRWEPGEEGEERRLELELKLLADVGLVGQPNAGKSTLLSAISKARPKVGDYPFTTLTPNLGVVSLSDFRTFVVADIPGIIEGAHEGKGLGLQFLRHIERTRTLAFLVPVDSPDPQAEYLALRTEIGEYSPELARRPHCVLLTKTDLLGPDAEVPHLEAPDAWGVFPISGVAGKGLPKLLEALWAKVRVVVEIEADPWEGLEEISNSETHDWESPENGASGGEGATGSRPPSG